MKTENLQRQGTESLSDELTEQIGARVDVKNISLVAIVADQVVGAKEAYLAIGALLAEGIPLPFISFPGSTSGIFGVSRDSYIEALNLIHDAVVLPA